MKAEELKKDLLAARRAINKVLKIIELHPELIGETEEAEKEVPNEDFMKSALLEWNNELNAKCTLNPSLIRMFNGRLKNYSKHDILSAIRGRLAFVKGNKWHNDPSNRSYMVDLGYVLGNDQKLEKYLNSYTQTELFNIKETTICKKENTSKNIME